TPAAGTLPNGTVGNAYSQTFAASGGTAPYQFTLSGDQPSGVTLNTSTGVFSGTPTTAGTYRPTVIVTDANNSQASFSFTWTVAPAASSFSFTPSAGTLAKTAMAGENYSETIVATGGVGTLSYSIASGSLPNGLTLDPATGNISGTVALNAEIKDYSFTIQVRDQNGSTATATYTLTVKPRAITVNDQVVNVAPGSTPNNVDLTRDATGGPFTSANIVAVEPSNAGTISIVRGEFAALSTPSTLGWYLKFIPNPAYSGSVKVNFSLTSALGISNTGTVTYTLNYDPTKVASAIDSDVHNFIRSRQNMISSTIYVPSLLERRQMENATHPVTARMMPSDQGLSLSFSTSLAQMQSARDSADGASGGYDSSFNIWIDGALLAHKDQGMESGKWGRFGMLNLGADYLLTDKALIGLSFHYDYMSDPTDSDSLLTGNGWLAGPYTSLEIGKGVFWNASLRYGGSSNDISTDFWNGSFDTTRWMADTSIEGQWALDHATTLTPKLRLLYFSETVKTYSVTNSSGDAIAIDGFNEKQFRVSLGAEIARSFTLENGSRLTPKLGLTGGFSGVDGSGAFGQATAGISMQTANDWAVNSNLLFNLEGNGDKSLGANVGLSRRF
ncbi:putative Ig domain-containing protein, partial [Allorhizobium sp. BGMRC 0089]|uniref:putative Ig domain-containing protein n=1 Tax=Allorhizobium sonneratiae TaxID=2934936 RepID=UPI0020333CA1